MKRILITLSLLTLLTACKNQEKSKLLYIPKETGKAEIPSTSAIQNYKDSSVIKPTEIMTGIYKDKDDVYHLRYILEVGKTYSFNTKDVNKETIHFQGQSESISQETYDLISFKVLDFKDGKYNLEVTMGGKKEIIKGDGKQMVLDTNGKKPSDPELAKTWKFKKSISNAVFTMDMDIYGTASNIKGMESIYSKAKSLLGSDLKEKELENVINIIKQTLNPENFKQMFETSLVKFPSKGLKIGEKWNNDPSKKDQGYNQLVKSDSVTTEIKIQGYVPSQSKKETDKEGITHSLSVTGTQYGTILIDNQSGWISKGTFTLTNTIKEGARKGEESQEVIRKIENYHYINH